MNEEHEGKRFLVLERVEGQTLAERLKKTASRSMKRSISAAHEKGIIHTSVCRERLGGILRYH